MKHVQAEGAQVPAIGLGTWQMKGETCREAVVAGLSMGYRHVDTAQMYGNEQEVGRALEQSEVPRDAVWVTTKVWPDDLAHDDLLRVAEQSLRHLRTDWIDLLLIHWPNPRIELQETLGAMQELKQAGKVRSIGVSNFPPRLLAEALELAPVTCDQVEHHVYLHLPRLEQMAREREIMLTAYCPLARGRVAGDPVLGEIGEAHGKTPAQVALRWLVQKDPQVAAVPKASSEPHLRDNLDVFDFELTGEEMRRVGGLDRGERLIAPDFGPDWGG